MWKLINRLIKTGGGGEGAVVKFKEPTYHNACYFEASLQVNDYMFNLSSFACHISIKILIVRVLLIHRQGRVFARLLVQGFNNSKDPRLGVEFAGR